MLGSLRQFTRKSGSRSVWNGLLNTVSSLQVKATVLVVVLILSVTAAVSGYLVQTSGQLARDQHATQLVQMAKVLAKAAATIVADGELDKLDALAKEAANGAPLLYVIFSDVDGRQLAVAGDRNANALQQLLRQRSEGTPAPGLPVFHEAADGVPVHLEVTYPIALRESNDASPQTRSTRLLGYVRTGMVANGWHQTMSSRLDLAIGVGILATVAAIPLGFLLIRRIVAPLEGLAAAMLRFSHGDHSVRSTVRQRDEIGQLAAAFNRMADQSQHTHERIVRLNAELEKRVTQRTQQLRELASREPLTGLYNRRYFNEMLERRFAEAVRYGTELSCVMIDLDGFKAVNDAFGHHVGDQLLVLTASTITGELRSADVAARYGGDEFVLLLPQTDMDRTRVLIERVAEEFARDVAEALPQVRTSMSMGIASVPSADIRSSESLIRAADRAMYEAKGAGKNRIVTATASAPNSAST